MKKLVASAVVASAVALGAAGSASAAPSAPGQCVSQGLKTLAALNLTSAAARQQVDYSLLDVNSPVDEFRGAITIDLNAGTNDPVYLPLSTVISLHRSNPSYFSWCVA